MHRIRDACLIAGLFVGSILVTRPVEAQYTADFQTNLISGVTNNWTGDYVVGSNNVADVLLIQAAGLLTDGNGYLGYEIGSSNNSVLVSDRFSDWRNANSLYLGYSGAGNTLVISNRGLVVSDNGFVGYNSSSSNNSVLVTGSVSLWSDHTNLYVGYSGAGNSLIISGSGTVHSANAYIGSNTSAVGNSVVVTDGGSVWDKLSSLYVGGSGAGNSLVISNGGSVKSVFATSGFGNSSSYIGYNSSSSNNYVLVTGTNSAWVNTASTLSVGYFGAGNTLAIINGGKVNNWFSWIGQRLDSSNNSVLVAGTGSVWQITGGELWVGNGGKGNSLSISNGGQVSTLDDNSYIGDSPGSDNNQVFVNGSGSVWSTLDLYVGGLADSLNSAGANNSLWINNGGCVVSQNGRLGGAYVSSNNSVLVTDSGSVWSNSGDLYVGDGGAGNSLTISNGGKVFNGYGYVGLYPGSNNNVLVTGSGSIWTNRNQLFFGSYGAGNSMVISDGGHVIGTDCFVGNNGSNSNRVVVTGAGAVWSSSSQLAIGNSTSFGNTFVISNGGRVLDNTGLIGGSGNNNTVLVTDTGSVWSNKFLAIGSGGTGNSLVISNGGQVISSFTDCVGCNSDSSSNSVRVVDGGVWRNGTSLFVGENNSSGCSIVIAGGSVFANSLLVGTATPMCDNSVELDSGSLTITNAAHNAVLEVRYGQLILNGGVLQVDKLVMTNACGLFIRNGGTLIVGTLVLDPNLSAVGDGIPNGWKQQYGLDPLDPNVANEDPDGDGLSNLQEFLAGSNPVADIKAITQEGTDIRVTWQAAATKTNALQATAGDVDGSYSTNGFTDVFTVTNTDGSVTNYLDAGAATNFPSRFYRVRLVP